MRNRTRGALVLAMAAALAASALPASAKPADPSSDFVSTRGTEFTVGNQVFPVVGANNYYPMYSSEMMTDAVFESASGAGFTTMRVWASFAIGSPGGGDKATLADGDKGIYFQYWDDLAGEPAFNDGATGLEKLDYVIAKAGEENLRLILPLTNNWGAFGGMDQYNIWADSDYHSDFYTDPEIRGWYQEWIEHLLNRTNTITGIAYKDDPTIMAWELANEPRCIGDGGPADGSWGTGLFPRDPSCTADTITPWVEEMSAYIKSIDSNHLVTTGDEGFFNDPDGADWMYDGSDGVDTVAWASVPTIDYMSFHLYPDHWGTDAEWGNQWIVEHNAAAKDIKKPALLGEFGWQDKSSRNAVYQDWLTTSLATGGAGSLVWILSDIRDDGTLYPDYDGFTIHCPGSVCTTVANYGEQLRSPAWGTYAPVADDDHTSVPFATSASVDVTANDTAYKTTISVDAVDLDPTIDGRQTSVTIAGGSASVDQVGVVTVIPDEGFAGKIYLPYTVEDGRGVASNVATLVVEVEPDPNGAVTLVDFDAPLPPWASYGGGSLSTVDGHLEVVSNGEAFVIDLDPAIDLSGKTKVSVDFLGTTTGVNAELVLQVGPGWEWCQIAPVAGTWTDPAHVEFDLDTLSLSCQAGLSEVHRVGMWTHAGTHMYDNLIAE